ncbi:MAG: hypothetical protein L3J29_07240 [Cyclobacteriaceae bacterium]|nr:hypothetical protein [Cyclobacteriaceae bacterium]
MQKLILCTICLFVLSCNINSEKEVIDELEQLASGSPNATSGSPFHIIGPVDYGHVIVGLVSWYVCSPSGSRTYTMYTTANKVSANDRDVYAAVLKGTDFIDGKILTIPAGQSVSNSVAVFVGASVSYGDVYSKAFAVFENGVETSSKYNLIAIGNTVRNCYMQDIGSANCYAGIFPADNPDTAANEGPGDQDRDGICNSIDVDDNGNGIPDDWEDWKG